MRAGSVRTGVRYRRRERVRVWAVIGLMTVVVTVAASSTGHAADLGLPPVNLGDTSFQDGIAFPGWLVDQTLIAYHANGFRDSNGRDMPGQNRVSSWASTTHLAWISNFRLLGGYYGIETVIPLVSADVETDFGPNGHERGLGDIMVGPLFIQWSDSKLFGMPYFHRVSIDFILPTGEYRRNSSVNPGSNVYSFNPYYSLTLVPADRWEVSARFYYLWNSENPQPFKPLGADDAQPGQAVHMNAAVSYEIVRDLRIGVSAYGLRQITDDRIDGTHQAHSKEQVIGVGPGLKYGLGPLSIYLHAYYETAAENRFEGYKGLIRAQMVF